MCGTRVVEGELRFDNLKQAKETMLFLAKLTGQEFLIVDTYTNEMLSSQDELGVH